MKRPKQIETITLAVTLPRTGEKVTRKELKEYILEACWNHWAWGARMKWKIPSKLALDRSKRIK